MPLIGREIELREGKLRNRALICDEDELREGSLGIQPLIGREIKFREGKHRNRAFIRSRERIKGRKKL